MFDALEAGDFQSIEGIVTQLTSYFNPSPTADPRTRGSVRRASGFVQIPISLIYCEENSFPLAHLCNCSRQLLKMAS